MITKEQAALVRKAANASVSDDDELILQLSDTILALYDTDALAEVQALRDERDAARKALMSAGIALHVSKRETEAAEANEAKYLEAWQKENADHGAAVLREDNLKAELAATQAKLERVVEAASGLGKWCVENIPPDETLDRKLCELDAALEGAKP